MGPVIFWLKPRYVSKLKGPHDDRCKPSFQTSRTKELNYFLRPSLIGSKGTGGSSLGPGFFSPFSGRTFSYTSASVKMSWHFPRIHTCIRRNDHLNAWLTEVHFRTIGPTTNSLLSARYVITVTCEFWWICILKRSSDLLNENRFEASTPSLYLFPVLNFKSAARFPSVDYTDC